MGDMVWGNMAVVSLCMVLLGNNGNIAKASIIWTVEFGHFPVCHLVSPFSSQGSIPAPYLNDHRNLYISRLMLLICVRCGIVLCFNN